MSQFAQSAEETAKKAKQKAMDEDYDSDEETKEQWSARYDRELEEKKKKHAAASVAGSFKFTPTSSVAGSNAGSGDEAEPKGLSSFLAPPAAGSVFSRLSRSASPASATGSVFDAPRSGTPGAISKDNPFASLSQQASEKGDADDEDEEESADGDEQSLAGGGHDGADEQDEEEEATPRANGVTKRKGPFEEDEESAPETPAKQPRTDGLFGRVTKDGDRTPLASTGANSGSLFSTSAPADQTWTPKDPIKFSTNNTSSEGETGTAKKPLFSFTAPNNNSSAKPGVFSGLFSGTQGSPATSGAATPSNPFANLSTPADKIKAADSLAVPPSGATSVFSTPGWSRATTPGPSDMSGAESTAGEGEEAKPDAQIDIADMAEDKKGAEVLFESPKVKATKYEKGDPKKDTKDGWNVVGVGPIAILRKEGVVSLLMRSHPAGKVVINSRMNAVLNAQTMKKRARVMVVSASGPEPYLISFQTEADCENFVEKCKEGGSK